MRLITLDPGHFHAALVQKEMYPEVEKQGHVYAPLGSDLVEHLHRVARFNQRAENPTCWQLEVHTGPDYLERMLRERPGDVVVLAGRNHRKIEYILAAVEAGLNVLADKPWIIEAADLPRLEAALDLADARGLVAYDIMTERFEITSILQRLLVSDPNVFGEAVTGSPEDPAVYMKSVHHLAKSVAGAPLIRPAWFFDVQQQGEGLTDVGTHLVDLAQWILFPEQAIDYRRDVDVTAARRWPTVLSPDQFRRVTGQDLESPIEYYCNTSVTYALRGIYVKLDVLWNYEGPADTHLAIYRGTRSRIEVRDADVLVFGSGVKEDVRRRLAGFAGVGVEEEADHLRVIVPQRYYDGHEAHFAAVARQFFSYLKDRSQLPAWEKPNMLAKYYTTTRGVELARALTGSGNRK